MVRCQMFLISLRLINHSQIMLKNTIIRFYTMRGVSCIVRAVEKSDRPKHLKFRSNSNYAADNILYNVNGGI